MAETIEIDRNAIVRATDTETLAPKLLDGGADHAKTDYLEITGNGASRVLVLEAKNDDETNVGLTIQAKGAGVLTIDGANLILSSVPTSDPSVSGQVWANTNVLTLSA